jgi:hypothetical protein
MCRRIALMWKNWIVGSSRHMLHHNTPEQVMDTIKSGENMMTMPSTAMQVQTATKP